MNHTNDSVSEELHLIKATVSATILALLYDRSSKVEEIAICFPS